MANESSKSSSGEDREQNNDHLRTQGPQEEEVKSAEESVPKMTPRKQENLENRGYEEDQPQNPVRNTGSIEQNSDMPAGEPDKHD